VTVENTVDSSSTPLLPVPTIIITAMTPVRKDVDEVIVAKETNAEDVVIGKGTNAEEVIAVKETNVEKVADVKEINIDTPVANVAVDNVINPSSTPKKKSKGMVYAFCMLN
jgi:hypothetical protein